MEDRFYREYECSTIDNTLSGSGDLGDEFRSSLELLKVFDRLGFMRVHPDHGGRPHNHMNILIDGRHFSEHIIQWTRRFE